MRPQRHHTGSIDTLFFSPKVYDSLPLHLESMSLRVDSYIGPRINAVTFLPYIIAPLSLIVHTEPLFSGHTVKKRVGENEEHITGKNRIYFRFPRLGCGRIGQRVGRCPTGDYASIFQG